MQRRRAFSPRGGRHRHRQRGQTRASATHKTPLPDGMDPSFAHLARPGLARRAHDRPSRVATSSPAPEPHPARSFDPACPARARGQRRVAAARSPPSNPPASSRRAGAGMVGRRRGAERVRAGLVMLLAPGCPAPTPYTTPKSTRLSHERAHSNTSTRARARASKHARRRHTQHF